MCPKTVGLRRKHGYAKARDHEVAAELNLILRQTSGILFSAFAT
jgi:hypothetical protein